MKSPNTERVEAIKREFKEFAINTDLTAEEAFKLWEIAASLYSPDSTPPVPEGRTKTAKIAEYDEVIYILKKEEDGWYEGNTVPPKKWAKTGNVELRTPPVPTNATQISSKVVDVVTPPVPKEVEARAETMCKMIHNIMTKGGDMMELCRRYAQSREDERTTLHRSYAAEVVQKVEALRKRDQIPVTRKLSRKSSRQIQAEQYNAALDDVLATLSPDTSTKTDES